MLVAQALINERSSFVANTYEDKQFRLARNGQAKSGKYSFRKPTAGEAKKIKHFLRDTFICLLLTRLFYSMALCLTSVDTPTNLSYNNILSLSD